MGRRARGGSLDGTIAGALLGPGGLIRRVQSGTVAIGSGATSATATLGTAVNTAHAIVLFHGGSIPGTGETQFGRIFARVDLTNSTTVTATRGISYTSTITVGFTVVEFFPGVIRRVQRGTIAMTSGTSATATLGTAVNTARAWVRWLGFSTTASVQDEGRSFARVDLTNSTTVTLTVGTSLTASGYTTTGSYEVVELW